MLWRGRRQSENVEDRRGASTGKIALGGGLGTIAIIAVVWLLGGDPGQVMNMLGGGQPQQEETGQIPADDTMGQFVSVVLAEVEDTWDKIFSENGQQYRKPKLVLYNGQVQSACGLSSSATGPFYCPGDEKVYIDLSFFEEMKDRFSMKGDFPLAYVIAHEVGHHVQKLLGTMDQMMKIRQEVDETTYNQYSVRLELQADFFAGVWAHYADQWKGILEPGDIDEALNAASAIGDDRIQKQSQGYVVPDSFTHGTSEQRSFWFKKGYQTGDVSQGDTFKARNL